MQFNISLILEAKSLEAEKAKNWLAIKFPIIALTTMGISCYRYLLFISR